VCLRWWARVTVCGLGLSLMSCSTGSFDSSTDDFGERWKIAKASEACNADIERERWGSLSAMLTYERHEPDHGYRACMNGKLKQHASAVDGTQDTDATPSEPTN
jgi:hypothetical protein